MRCYGSLAAILTQFLITASIADELPQVCVTDASEREDMVGERLVYNVKESIRKSRAMKLVPSEGGPRCLRLIVSTMAFEGPPGQAPARNTITIYHVTWVMSSRDLGHRYVDETLGLCGGSRVLDTAETIVAKTEKLLSSMTPPSGEPRVSPSPSPGQ